MTDLDVEIELRVRERTAHLQAANRELESFVAAVAHDLRSPLRAIQGVTHVLLERHGEGSAGARECIDCIRLNVEQMSRMLDGLTRICRSDRGEPSLPGAGQARTAGKSVQPPVCEGGSAGREPLAPVDGATFDVALDNLRQRDVQGPETEGTP